MSFSWRKPRSFDEDLTVVLTAIRPTLAAVVANRRRALELERMVEERTNELMDTLQQQADFQQRIIEAQRQALEELSTPLIPLMDRILVMPIIGSVDTARARDILRALLAGIGLHRARVVILDITGVALVDSGVAAHLNKTMQAARLKGAYIIITGIADAVAETMVDLGIDWTHVEIQRDLQSGLLSAVGRMGMRLVRQAGV
jgi:rsbT co-antagonist protein RsbR